jgi:hypothetical protein
MQPDRETETARNTITTAVLNFLNEVANSPDTHRGGLEAAAHDGQPKDHDVTGIGVPCRARFMPNGTIVWMFTLTAGNGQGMILVDGGDHTWSVSFPNPQSGVMEAVADSMNMGSFLQPHQLTAVAQEAKTHLETYAHVWFPRVAPTAMMTAPQPVQAPVAHAPQGQPVSPTGVREMLRFKTPWIATALAFLSLCIGVFGVIPGTIAAVSLGLQWRDVHRSGQPAKTQPWLIAATVVTAIIFLIFCYNTVQTLTEAYKILNSPEQPTW